MNNCDNSFASVDRLMEFGMSMAVAQQMVNTMNHCMQNMYVPGAGILINAQPSKQEFHLTINNRVAGPFNLTELAALAKAHTLTESTLVWSPGMSGWMKARDIPEINKLIILNK